MSFGDIFPLRGPVRGCRVPVTPGELVAFLAGPRVVLHGFPKGGTNLLLSLVCRLPRVCARWSVGSVASGFDGLGRGLVPGRGQCLTTHLYWERGLSEFLSRHGARSLFVCRDLRDVLVSRMFYTRDKLAGHPAHAAMRSLAGPEEQLILALEGIADPAMGFPSLRSWAEGYLPWLSDPSCLTVRFEALIGPEGGGSAEAQENEVRRIAAHLGLSLGAAQVRGIAGRVFSRGSTTFREGRVGGWRPHFTPRVAERFAEVLGDLPARYGYG